MRLKARVIACGVVGLLALSGAARSAPPSNDTGAPISLPLDQEATAAHLIQNPGNDDLAREYPQVPWRMKLGGRSSMACMARATGLLDDCHVVSENPEGLGFGAAEVRTAVYFRVDPATRDGKPIDGPIIIPMRWQPFQADAVKPLVLAPASPAALALGRRVVQLQAVAERMQARWKTFLTQQTAQMDASTAPESTRAVMAAYKQGLTDTIVAEADRQAHELASRESEADLRATVTFLETPAGRAWVAAERQSEANEPQDFAFRVSEAADARYCPGGVCPAGSAELAASSR